MTKLSIITINYNNANGLKKTIESVVCQNFKDYEFIIIDGKSTDESVDIIEKFESSITYWVSEPDSGLYNAMNKGVLRANGEFLLFLNSGDFLTNQNVLEDIFSNNINAHINIIRGNQITDYKTHTEKWYNFGDRDITLYDLYIGSFHHQSTFFKKNLFEKYGLYSEEYKIVSDWEFSLRLILGAEKSIYRDVDVVVYEYGGISSNAEGLKLRVEEREKVLRKFIPEYIRTDYDNLKHLLKEKQYIATKPKTFEENITVFLMQHQIPLFIFRVISKIYRILGIK